MGTVSNFTFEHHVDQNMVFGCLKFKRKTNNGELLGKHLDRSKKTQIACRLQDVFFFQLQGSCFYHLWRCGWVWNKKHLPLRLTRLGAKSVCGSAAEWGRAERGAASHPPDSLMDHHVDVDGEEEEEDPSIYIYSQLELENSNLTCTLQSPLFASYDN